MKLFWTVFLFAWSSLPVGLVYAGINDGLVAYYPFNGNARDESGNGNNGALINVSPTIDRFGVPNSAYRFSGSSNLFYIAGSSCYIDIPDSSSLRVSNVTVSVWIKPEFAEMPSYVWPVVLTKRITTGDPAPYNSYVLHAGSTHYEDLASRYRLTGGRDGIDSPVTEIGSIKEGIWQHVCLVISTNTVTIYINGAMAAFISDPNASSPIFSGESLLIGTAKRDGQQEWFGCLDDIRIYNRTLTPQEVQALYNEAGGVGVELDIVHGRAYPIATETNRIYQLQGRDTPFTSLWYNINEQIHGSGITEHGYERGNGPIFLPARRWKESQNTDGIALKYDGVNDFAYHPHHQAFNLTNAMTLEVWVKPDTLGPARLITKASSPSIVCYSLDLNAANRPLFRIFNSSGNAFLSITGSTALATGEWKHVSASWDGSLGRIFVDGTLDGSGSGSGVTRISTISSLLIGGIFGSESFNGSLDQVRVWGVARSEDDVMADYQSILMGSESGLVGLWKFSTDEGQSAIDSTANGFDLNLGSDPILDSSDPVWKNESFPPPSSYMEIFNFGEPCLVVGHESLTGGVYQLQNTTNFNPFAWGNKGGSRLGMSDWMDYIVFPTNRAELFKAYGNGNGLNKGLIAFYPFNGNANDESGNGNNGTDITATLTNDRSDNANSAYHFNNTAIGMQSPLPDLESLTISMWFRFSTSGTQTLLFEGDSAAGRDLHLTVSDTGIVGFRTKNNHDMEWSAPSFGIGEWHQLVFVADNDLNSKRIWFDGALVGTTNAVGPFCMGYHYNLQIGRRQDGLYDDNRFYGDIDDIRLYNRALTSDEVWVLYNLEK